MDGLSLKGFGYLLLALGSGECRWLTSSIANIIDEQSVFLNLELGLMIGLHLEVLEIIV